MFGSPLESMAVDGFYTALLVLAAVAFAGGCGYLVYRLVKG